MTRRQWLRVISVLSALAALFGFLNAVTAGGNGHWGRGAVWLLATILFVSVTWIGVHFSR